MVPAVCVMVLVIYYLQSVSRGVKEQNARLKLQLHYERNEGKRVIQTKMNQAKEESSGQPKDETEYTPPPQTREKKNKVEANSALKSNLSRSKLADAAKASSPKKEKRKSSIDKDITVKTSPSIEKVDELKPKKPKSNLKKTKLNSMGQSSTPKSTMSTTIDDFTADIMNALNETVSSEMSDVELPPVFSPDHGEHLDDAMSAMRLKLEETAKLIKDQKKHEKKQRMASGSGSNTEIRLVKKLK